MKPNPRSLAYRTDLAILNFEGKVEDRGGYYFAETPNNPGYFWGNLLVMKSPPATGDFERWTELFRQNFAHRPLVKHMTFGWDSASAEAGDLEPFISAGFDIEKSVVLTATTTQIAPTAKMNTEVQVRALTSDADWEAAIKNQVACRGKDFSEEKYLPFKRTLMAKYRRMANAGLGNWFGAFLGDQLVADCGVYIFNGVGRYQVVGTDPQYRRRGICAALIYHSARLSFEKNAKTLVMVADPDDQAARVYKSVGFKETERAIGAYKWPQEEWSK